MYVSKTTAEVTNVNPRKENGEDGGVLASDVSVELAVPRETIDALIEPLLPKEAAPFTDQFYNGDDTRLDVIYPLTYGHKIEDLRVTLHFGLKPMVFEGARIARGMKITPQVGQYCKIECKLQLYPTEAQSGKLDKAVKEHIEVEIAPMTDDLTKQAA